MSPTTYFSDPAAVDAWDNCFRWRDGAILRDLTIDFTWRRVSEAIAAVEGVHAPLWAQRFFDAFSSWRLLPDQRVLRGAGTGSSADELHSPCAVLNAAAFVSSPGTRLARFERSQFVDTSELAVRLLDDALLGRSGTGSGSGNGDCIGSGGQADGPRIGMVGLGDAMQLLGLAYDSRAARQHAGEMAAALAEGSLRGAADLAAQRGAADCDLAEVLQRWRRRGATEALLDKVQRSGLRHAQLTAIEPQPALALLANNASDAVDPRLPGRSAAGLARAATETDAGLEVSLRAQIDLRAAMQPWIDAAIDYPLVCAAPPDQETMATAERLASARGLRPMRVRVLGPALAAGAVPTGRCPS